MNHALISALSAILILVLCSTVKGDSKKIPDRRPSEPESSLIGWDSTGAKRLYQPSVFVSLGMRSGLAGQFRIDQLLNSTSTATEPNLGLIAEVEGRFLWFSLGTRFTWAPTDLMDDRSGLSRLSAAILFRPGGEIGTDRSRYEELYVAVPIGLSFLTEDSRKTPAFGVNIGILPGYRTVWRETGFGLFAEAGWEMNHYPGGQPDLSVETLYEDTFPWREIRIRGQTLTLHEFVINVGVTFGH